MSREMDDIQKKYFRTPVQSSVVIAWSDAVVMAYEFYALGKQDAITAQKEPTAESLSVQKRKHYMSGGHATDFIPAKAAPEPAGQTRDVKEVPNAPAQAAGDATGASRSETGERLASADPTPEGAVSRPAMFHVQQTLVV